MNPLSAAILTSLADDCKRHWDAGRFGRADGVNTVCEQSCVLWFVLIRARAA